MSRGYFKRLYIFMVALLIIMPFVVVLGVSLNPAKNITFPPKSLSMSWYLPLLTEAEWQVPILNSLFIALIAGVVAVSVALMANYLLWRFDNRFARLTFALGLGPFLLPPVIIAMGASIFWAEVGWFGRIEATIISHGVFFVTLPLVIIARGFELLSKDVLEASQTLGATHRQTFIKIVFPQIRPYVITGFALVTIISVNEYLIAYMVSGFSVETLPIKIFNNVRYGYSPVIASAAMTFTLITVVVLIVVSRITDLTRLLGGRHSVD